MSDFNRSTPTWIKAQGTNFTGQQRTTVTIKQAVLHAIIVGTYSPGATFRVANGTATNIVNYITGSFVPLATGIQPTIEFKELEFANGIAVFTGGTIDLTAVYNDLI